MNDDGREEHLALSIDQATTLPTPAPLDADWSYNGDFWEVGYSDEHGEWIVLATLSGGSLDTEADETWKMLHHAGVMMAAAARMLATLRRVKAMMEAEPDAYSFDERVDVEGAILAATTDAAYWTRDDA
jgi:hypothetical protein